MTRSPPRRMPETSMQKTTLPQAGDRVAVGSRWSATRARTAKELAIGRDRCCVVRTAVAALAIGDHPDRMALPQGLAPWVLALPIALYGTGLFLLTIAAGVTSIATTSLSIGTRGRLSLAR